MQIQLDKNEAGLIMDLLRNMNGAVGIRQARSVFDKIAAAIEAEKDEKQNEG